MAENVDAVRARVCYEVLKALADLNVKEEEQEIDLSDIGHDALDGVNMQYTIDFLHRNVSHVKKLRLFWDEVTMEAVEILHTYLTETTTLDEIWLRGNLGNEKAERLLSGLHGNQFVKDLILDSTGLVGAIGGTILSDLLLNNSALDMFYCDGSSLGPEGARAMQPGLRGNDTMEKLVLQGCNLGDEGLQFIADAASTTVKILDLAKNGFTASGLPHVTRRLLQRESLLEHINLSRNPRLFDDEANTREFSNALRNATVTKLILNYCQLPGHVLTALFQDVSSNKRLLLYVYDRVQLQEPHLGRLLEIIANMSSLFELWINLDFMDESVLSSLHRNTSICRLSTGEQPGTRVRDDNDRVADIMERNNRLEMANGLLNSEARRTIPLGGLWANAIASLFDDNSGATAVYKILHQKLPDWVSVANNTRTVAPIPAVPVAGDAIVGAITEDADHAFLDDTATATINTTNTETDWREEINKRDKIIAALQKELQESKAASTAAANSSTTTTTTTTLQEGATAGAAAAVAAAATVTYAMIAATGTTSISNNSSNWCTAKKRSYTQAAAVLGDDDDDDDDDDGDNSNTETSETENGAGPPPPPPPKKRPARSF